MRHRTTEAVFSYFNGLRGNRPAPLRVEIDPAALKPVLPDIFIMEKGRDGIVRFRLAGTRVCAILGRELRESGFADIWDPAVRHRMRLAADTVLANRKGLEIAVTALDVDGGTLDLEMLMLPLFSRSDRCDRIFGSLAAFQTLPPVESQFRVLYPADLLFEPAPPPRASHPRHDPRPLHPGARAGHLTVLDGGRRD